MNALALILAPGAAAVGGADAYYPPVPVEMVGLLGVHNRERSRVGAGPMWWDAALAAQASRHARVLARSGRLTHSPRASRPGQGENLAMGSVGYYSPLTLAVGWATEKRHFRSGVFPAVSRTGRWSDVGHYTQMVWPTTTRVGCGTATGRGMLILVCRYTPAGNRDGVRLGR